MQASAKLFLAKGFAGVSMREIAAAAHTGVGNIYNYFRSKTICSAALSPRPSETSRPCSRSTMAVVAAT